MSMLTHARRLASQAYQILFPSLRASSPGLTIHDDQPDQEPLSFPVMDDIYVPEASPDSPSIAWFYGNLSMISHNSTWSSSSPSSAVVCQELLQITLTDLPTDLLLYIGEYFNPNPNFDDESNDSGTIGTVHDRIQFSGVLGNKDVLNFYLQHCDKTEICNSLARSGSLRALKWAYKQGCPLEANTCKFAAYRGNMEMLEWLHSQNCPLSKDTYEWAARHGNAVMMLWLKEQDCPVDNDDALYAAAESGNLEVLQWLRSHGTGTWSTSKVLDATDVYNNIEMLTWLYSLGCKCKNSIAYCTNVLYSQTSKDIDVILNPYDFDDYFDDDDDDDDDVDDVDEPRDGPSVNIVENSQTSKDIYDSLNSDDFDDYFDDDDVDDDVVDDVDDVDEPRDGPVEMWAHSPHCCWYNLFYYSYEKAAFDGKLELLKWLCRDACPWTKGPWNLYSYFGGCIDDIWSELESRKCMYRFFQWTEVPIWDFDFYLESIGSRVFKKAVHSGNLEMLKWLRDQKCPWSGTAYEAAAYEGFEEVLQWLKDHGCPEPDKDEIFRIDYG